LDRPERLLRVMESPIVGTRPVDAAWRGAHLFWSGGYPSLELVAPFDTAGGSLILEVLRPADTWIGAERAPGIGMLTDAESCVAGVEDVIPIALMEALYALMSRSPGRPGQWSEKYAEAKERALTMYRFDGQYFAPKSSQPAAGATA